MTHRMNDAAAAAVKGLSVEQSWRTLGAGITAGLWGWDDLEAFQLLVAARAVTPAPKPRLPPRTRMVRWEQRPAVPSGRFIAKRSVDATLDWALPDGAYRCLDLILSLAGRDGTLRTFTSSLAKQLGRTTRTVQNYYRALVDAGYIQHRFDRRSGVVMLYLTAACYPVRYEPQGHERLYDRARRSDDPLIRSALARLYTLSAGGAKMASGINLINGLQAKRSPATEAAGLVKPGRKRYMHD